MICDETRTSECERVTKGQKRKHRPRWDRRVIRSVGDEESVDPKRASGRRMSRKECHVGMVAHIMKRASGRS